MLTVTYSLRSDNAAPTRPPHVRPCSLVRLEELLELLVVLQQVEIAAMTMMLMPKATMIRAMPTRKRNRKGNRQKSHQMQRHSHNRCRSCWLWGPAQQILPVQPCSRLLPSARRRCPRLLLRWVDKAAIASLPPPAGVAVLAVPMGRGRKLMIGLSFTLYGSVLCSAVLCCVFFGLLVCF